ncbi:MAG: hypothetical protein ACM3ST_08840 [Bdellovibrio bacteriovorus]
MLPPVDIRYVAQELARLGEEVRRLADESTEGLEPHPEVLTDGLADLLDALEAADSPELARRGQTLQGHLAGEPDGLLTHGLNLLSQLADLAARLHQPQTARAIEGLALPLACWLMRRGAELTHPEPVINAAAALANNLRDPDELAALYLLMSEVVEGMSPRRTQEASGDRPGPATERPWRVLLLNRAIVATRSHRPNLMVEAFQAVCEHLPDDAPSFFREGMGQMEPLNYPQPVRDVMDRYYHLWCAGQRLH